MGSLSIWHWLVVLLIVVVVFGTKRLKNMGQDVGEAVKNFKQAVNETTTEETSKTQDTLDKTTKKLD